MSQKREASERSSPRGEWGEITQGKEVFLGALCARVNESKSWDILLWGFTIRRYCQKMGPEYSFREELSFSAWRMSPKASTKAWYRLVFWCQEVKHTQKSLSISCVASSRRNSVKIGVTMSFWLYTLSYSVTIVFKCQRQENITKRLERPFPFFSLFSDLFSSFFDVVPTLSICNVAIAR